MTEHRIRVGTWPANAMTSAYAIKNFPSQTDQLNYYIWVDPISPSGFFRQYDAVIDDTLDGTRGGIGKYNGSWYFDPLTPLMAQYWRNTIFPTDGWNEDVTIVTYTVSWGWVALNITAHWNEVARVAQPRPGSKTVQAVKLIDFDQGTLAASGGEFTSEFTSEFVHGGIPE